MIIITYSTVLIGKSIYKSKKIHKYSETWTLKISDQRYWERCAIWCWRMEKTSWTDHVTHEVLHSVKEEGIVLNTTKRRLIEFVISSVRTVFYNILL